MALVDILADAVNRKWQWYTVQIETDIGQHDVEVEAYSYEDAVARAVAIFRHLRSDADEIMSGECYVFIGRKQLMTFEVKS